jgi:hypothetical protein
VSRVARALLSLLARVLDCQRPLRRAVTLERPLAAAPVSLAFLTLCLVASLLWASPGAGHRLAAACCAYRGWRPGSWTGDGLRLADSAFLLRRPGEVIWTVAATFLVVAPFEAMVGSRRMLLVAVLGHVVPTLAVAVSGLSQVTRLGGGGLDVGSSAVVVALAAGLAVRGRSPAVAACLVLGQAADLVLDTPLGAAEHLIAIGTGALVASALGAGIRLTQLGPVD